MKTLQFALFVLLVSVQQSFAQFDSFQKEYITPFFTHCYDVEGTSDGGFIISGIQDNPSANPTGLTSYITRMDCSEEAVWTKRYAGTSGLDNTEHEVAVLPDQQYVLCTSTGAIGSYDILLVKMDQDGNTIWANTYGGNGDDLQGGITVLADGNLAVVGYTKSYGVNAGTTYSDIYALKIDTTTGDVIWSATFGFSGTTGRAYDVVENEMGEIVLTGAIFHTATVATWAPIIKLDANGNFNNVTFYGLDNRNTIGVGLERVQGGYLLSGSSNILGEDWFSTLQYPFVMRIDDVGAIAWSSVIEGTPNDTGLGGMAYTPLMSGDTVAVAAETYHYQNQTADPTKRLLYLLDSNTGDLINARQYNGEGGQFPKIKHHPQGGYIMSAMTDENNGSNPGEQFWNGPIVNRLNTEFNSGCNETDRTGQTIINTPAFTANNTLVLDGIDTGYSQSILPALADSFAIALPTVDTFCEALLSPDMDVLFPTLSCGEAEAFFEASVDYPEYDITWDFGDGTVVSTAMDDTITHVYSTSGTFDVLVQISICSQTTDFPGTVEVESTGTDPTIENPGILCIEGDPIDLNSMSDGGTWSGTGITDSENGTFDPNQAGLGITEVTYTVCGMSDTIEIEVVEMDDASFDYDPDSFCYQDGGLAIAEISGLSGGSFTINNDGVIDAVTGEVNIDDLASGTYEITYTTAGTCPSSATSEIEVILPDATILSTGPLCAEGEPILMEALVPGGTWTGEAIMNEITGLLDPALVEGISTEVTYTIDNMCFDTQTVTLQLVSNPDLVVESDAIISLGESIPLVAIYDSGTITWTPNESLSCADCSNPIASPTETTTYLASLVDDNGCQTLYSVTIDVADDLIVYIPSMFSPNQDERNDAFFVRGTTMESFHLKIFNRWGNVVYETEDQRAGWDGTADGEVLPPSVFTYTLDAKTYSGEDVKRYGSITLIR